MFDDPYFPAITLGSELVAGSFWRDLQGEYWNGLVPARPLYQGVRKSVGDPETSRERVSDWGGPATVWALLCVAERRATRPNGEWGYSARRRSRHKHSSSERPRFPCKSSALPASPRAHCKQCGAAPRAPIAPQTRALDPPQNCAQSAAGVLQSRACAPRKSKARLPAVRLCPEKIR